MKDRYQIGITRRSATRLFPNRPSGLHSRVRWATDSINVHAQRYTTMRITILLQRENGRIECDKSDLFIGFDIPSERDIGALTARFILRRVIHCDLGKVERQVFHTVAGRQSGGGHRRDDDVFHLDFKV